MISDLEERFIKVSILYHKKEDNETLYKQMWQGLKYVSL